VLGVKNLDTVAEARARGEHTALRNNSRAIADVLGRHWGYWTMDAMMLGESQFEERLCNELPLLPRHHEALSFQLARHRDPSGLRRKFSRFYAERHTARASKPGQKFVRSATQLALTE